MAFWAARLKRPHSVQERRHTRRRRQDGKIFITGAEKIADVQPSVPHRQPHNMNTDDVLCVSERSVDCAIAACGWCFRVVGALLFVAACASLPLAVWYGWASGWASGGFWIATVVWGILGWCSVAVLFMCCARQRRVQQVKQQQQERKRQLEQNLQDAQDALRVCMDGPDGGDGTSEEEEAGDDVTEAQETDPVSS